MRHEAVPTEGDPRRSLDPEVDGVQFRQSKRRKEWQVASGTCSREKYVAGVSAGV